MPDDGRVSRVAFVQGRVPCGSCGPSRAPQELYKFAPGWLTFWYIFSLLSLFFVQATKHLFSMKTTSFASLVPFFALAPLVAGHGWVGWISVDGKRYDGNLPLQATGMCYISCDFRYFVLIG